MTDESNRKQRFCKILLEEAQTRKSLNENFRSISSKNFRYFYFESRNFRFLIFFLQQGGTAKNLKTCKFTSFLQYLSLLQISHFVFWQQGVIAKNLKTWKFQPISRVMPKSPIFFSSDRPPASSFTSACCRGPWERDWK